MQRGETGTYGTTSVGGERVRAFVREVLQRAVEDRPVKSRAGHLRGPLHQPGMGGDLWRSRLRDLNRRPDPALSHLRRAPGPA